MHRPINPLPRERPPGAAQSEAAKKAEAEQRKKINYFQAIVQVAAVTAMRRPPGPDYFGFGRYVRDASESPERSASGRE